MCSAEQEKCQPVAPTRLKSLLSYQGEAAKRESSTSSLQLTACMASGLATFALPLSLLLLRRWCAHRKRMNRHLFGPKAYP